MRFVVSSRKFRSGRDFGSRQRPSPSGRLQQSSCTRPDEHSRIRRTEVEGIFLRTLSPRGISPALNFVQYTVPKRLRPRIEFLNRENVPLRIHYFSTRACVHTHTHAHARARYVIFINVYNDVNN